MGEILTPFEPHKRHPLVLLPLYIKEKSQRTLAFLLSANVFQRPLVKEKKGLSLFPLLW